MTESAVIQTTLIRYRPVEIKNNILTENKGNNHSKKEIHQYADNTRLKKQNPDDPHKAHEHLPPYQETVTKDRCC